MPIAKSVSDTATPITMRLSEQVITDLKATARRLSYEKNCDLSYVDLIRSAIKKEYKIDVEENVKEDNDLPSLLISDEPRQFFNYEDISAFEATEHGQLIKQCIKDNNYVNFLKLWREQFDLWMKRRSIAYKLLRFYKPQNNHDLEVIERELLNVSSTLGQRQKLPECIMEPESLVIPTLDIGCRPSINKTYWKPHRLFGVMCSSIKSHQYQLDRNVIQAIQSAATLCKQIQSISRVGTYEISPQNLLHAVNQISQHEITPAHAIMSACTYGYLHFLAKDILDAPPLKAALQTKNYGTIWGIPVLLSKAIDDYNMIFTGFPESLGTLIEPISLSLDTNLELDTGRLVFVQRGTYSIAIVNDYASSFISNTVADTIL